MFQTREHGSSSGTIIMIDYEYNTIRGDATIIKPSTALRNEYNTISTLCKEKLEPVFLTKNGEGDLVLMSIEAYKYREEMLDLREKLLTAEANRLSGAKTYTLAQVNERLRELLDTNSPHLCDQMINEDYTQKTRVYRNTVYYGELSTSSYTKCLLTGLWSITGTVEGEVS